MTYLGYPRLHFAGAFQADVSTVNNDPAHYDDATFQARFQQPQSGSAPDQMNGWWNPRGTGAWRLRDCRVTSVLYSDGSLAASSLADPIVGGPLAGTDDRVSAKLVDLDTEQQMVSEIWGLQLRLLDSQGRPAWTGSFTVAPFSDIWVRYPPGNPDSFFSAVYQSIITDVQWTDGQESPLLHGKESALLAIHEIVRQGEGTSLTDPLDERDELAHYFRFKEIVEGRQMVKNADGKWVFDGPPIRFDVDGVYPMVDDPDTATLPEGSLVKATSRQFNATYTDLIRSLHRAFNGNPAGLRAAIGLMYTAEVQATELMRTPIVTASPTTAGPSFQVG